VPGQLRIWGPYDHPVKRSSLPFTWLLPFCAVLIWIGIIAAPATLVYVHLMQAAHGKSAVVATTGGLRTVIPRRRFLVWALDCASVAHGNLNEALNIFGIVGEALASWLFKTWPDSWYPDGFDLFSWRGVIFPFFCMPFWVLVGRGFDGLFRRCRLRWWTLLSGTLLCAFSATLAISLSFGAHQEDRADNYRVGGLVLWSILTAVFPLQWLMQAGSAIRARVRHTNKLSGT
jgi:hypothetical protein